MKIATEHTKLLLALSDLKKVGSATLRKVVSEKREIITNIDIERVSIEDLSKLHNKIKDALDKNSNAWNKAKNFVKKQIDEAKKYESRIISILDNEYPTHLKQVKDDPAILFIKGELPKNDNLVGIIGTRKPTDHGKEITKRIATFFAENNWSIVSGLAIGCDTIAHQTAVDNNSHTIAVLAHGLETIAPKQNKKLAEDILNAGGALISQFPFKTEIKLPINTEIKPINFAIRDKVQAGLSRGIVMIQSGVPGGSLIASRAILEYNRWLAVPSPTPLDRENKEPKIQANLIICDGKVIICDEKDIDIQSLLGKGVNLNNIIKLESKDDYPKLLHIHKGQQIPNNKSQPVKKQQLQYNLFSK